MDAGRGDLPRLLHDLESGRLTAGEAQEFVVLLQEAVAEELPALQRLTDARHWSLLFVRWKGGLFSDAARGRQAEALVGVLPKDTGILGGDLNTWLGPSEPAWRVLTQRFGDTPAFIRTPTFRDRLVLDHLLYDLPAGWQAAARVSSDTYDSDHHPVVAAITREQPRYSGLRTSGFSASSRATAR